MITMTQSVISVLSVMGVIAAVSAQAEEHENADYTGLPITGSANVYLPTTHKISAELSSLEGSIEYLECKPHEEHYDYTGTAVEGCRSTATSRQPEWSYVY